MQLFPETLTPVIVDKRNLIFFISQDTFSTQPQMQHYFSADCLSPENKERKRRRVSVFQGQHSSYGCSRYSRACANPETQSTLLYKPRTECGNRKSRKQSTVSAKGNILQPCTGTTLPVRTPTIHDFKTKSVKHRVSPFKT